MGCFGTVQGSGRSKVKVTRPLLTGVLSPEYKCLNIKEEKSLYAVKYALNPGRVRAVCIQDENIMHINIRLKGRIFQFK